MLRKSFSLDSSVSPALIISGRELLTLVKENPEASSTDLAVMAGYIRTTRKGEEVPDPTALTNALLEAKGINLKTDTRGRVAANETSVHRGGSVLIGNTYIQKAGIGPGDVLSIEVNSNTGQIVLNVIERVEGSPLPIKVYERKPKVDSDAASTAEPDAASATA